MKQIHCQVDRVLVRTAILFAYIGIAFIFYMGIDTDLSAREIVNRMIDEDRLLIIGWVISIPLLTYLLDLVLPKKQVIWCRIGERELEFYPQGPLVFKKSFVRETIDEIREVREFFPGYLSVYVFLKSGRYHYFRGYRRAELSSLLDWLKEAVPDISINKIEQDR